jgi:hypothetical protein
MPSLYRGFNQPLTSTIQTNIFRNDPRTPRDTDQEVHDHADAWFFKHFGIYARSTTIICSTDLSQARSYGATYRITPSTPCTIIYSPLVRDFLEHECELPSPSQTNVWEWLETKGYIAVKNVHDIKPAFLGEVMVCCESFMPTPII